MNTNQLQLYQLQHLEVLFVPLTTPFEVSSQKERLIGAVEELLPKRVGKGM